ncbi:hypothetical protein U1Q18_035565 [Sarracenia purpurea var. burkii]
MSEMRGGGSGGFDPSNLHLKKELTQIRKAARVLRDPGTTSSWRSPLSSARSAAAYVASSSNIHNCYLNKTGTIDAIGGGGGGGRANGISRYQSQLPFRVESKGCNAREKKVFLYNWRTQRSSSEKSAATARSAGEKKRPQPRQGGGGGGGDDEDDNRDGGSSSSVPEESAEDSSSDARNGGDSKSDTYIADRDRYASMISKIKHRNFSPSMKRAAIKKKSKKNTYLANLLSQQIVQSMNSKQALEGLPSTGALDLVDQSDDTEDYCNSEDLRQISAASPLLSRLKHKNWSRSSSKFLKNSRKDSSSYTNSTPALSTSSYKRYLNRNPSNVGSWDATTASFNDGDDEMDDGLDLPGRHGCGIPCYWSKRASSKHKGACGNCYSPSFSDTLRIQGSRILCGNQTMSHSDDEHSTNFGEIDLEALSRLDGRRWSCSCRSQEGLELVALNGEEDEDGSTPENNRSLSQKYRPMFFEELIGQNIVVQSLMNAISRGRISPVYLFQGPRGTGKTSTTRIFAAALNCLATEETKPCGVCRECSDFISGKIKNLNEVDSTSKKGIDRFRHLLKSLSIRHSSSSAFSRYKVFIIDECHLLPSNMWLAFLKFLEELPSRVVFIFMTNDLDNVPRTVLSRCQKYLFNKIKDSDVVARLRKISADENLDVESDALDLIALNADGSLRDAETMLDQLSLLGKRITSSLVNELVGVVSDEKLLELLELAMSSDTAETVKRARDLMDSGVDPMAVMSQLATLIMDIIAGTYHITDSKCNDSFSGGRNYEKLIQFWFTIGSFELPLYESLQRKAVCEAELDRLKNVLKLLSEAEKQLRVSSERSTWFTATLLQLGSGPSSDAMQSGSSMRQNSKTTEEDLSSASREAIAQKPTFPISLPEAAFKNLTNKEDPNLLTNGMNINSKHTQYRFISRDPSVVSHDHVVVSNIMSRCMNSDKLKDIWVRCIERCHSKTLRHLLLTHGKLIHISEVEGLFIAYIAFADKDVKTRAERFLSSITNSFENVLRYNVEVRIILFPDGETSKNSGKTVALPDSLGWKQMGTTEVINRERKAISSNAIDGHSDLDLCQELLKVSRRSFGDSEGKLGGNLRSAAGSPIPLVDGNAKTGGVKERIPTQRIESLIQEQRLETAWLQAVEKGTPGSLTRLKPEKNQILPQEGIYLQNQNKSTKSMDLSSQHWEDELNHEIKLLKINDGKAVQKDQIGKRIIDHCPISPSLLHDSRVMGNFSKDSMGYESGSGTGGCSAIFCWNNAKPRKRAKVVGDTRGSDESLVVGGRPVDLTMKGHSVRVAGTKDNPDIGSGMHRRPDRAIPVTNCQAVSGGR